MSLKKLSAFFLLIISAQAAPLTIMLDPIGDAEHTGREIDDTFERVISFQCAQQIKAEISSRMPKIHVVITRVPGDTIQPLQNASFANRMNVDFYIAIACYPHETIPSFVDIFYYLAHPIDVLHRYNDLQFYHVSEAHLISIHDSQKIADIVLKSFQAKDQNRVFVPRGVFGIPCKPLMGLKAPGVCIEVGLNRKDDWRYMIEPIMNAIEEIIS